MTDIYHELLEALSTTPIRIQELGEAAGPNAGSRSSQAAGAWSPAAVVAHLADIERVMRGRIEEALTRESPYFRSVDQEKLAEEHDYAHKEFRPALEDFAAERAETIQRLMNLALKGWERTGIHEERGEISVEDIAELLVDHDAAHLEQLQAVFAE